MEVAEEGIDTWLSLLYSPVHCSDKTEEYPRVFSSDNSKTNIV